LELKLPPSDAYLKLKHTLEEINGIIIAASHNKTEKGKVSPLLDNVAFGSGYY
jgi:U5 small nuclear ribonucleoprotein component